MERDLTRTDCTRYGDFGMETEERGVGLRIIAYTMYTSNLLNEPFCCWRL